MIYEKPEVYVRVSNSPKKKKKKAKKEKGKRKRIRKLESICTRSSKSGD